MKELNIEGERRKSARHSLLSIYYDSKIFLQNGIQHFYNIASSSTQSVSSSANNNNNSSINENVDEIEDSMKQRFPVVANQRCGTWYYNHDTSAAPNTHFKSTHFLYKLIYNYLNFLEQLK